MQAFVATKLDDYTKGKISRRQLLESLTVAAAATAATGGAQAAPAPNRALKAALVNHISYECPNQHQVADWYSRVFNMEQVTYPSEPSQIGMPFGKRNQKPLGVTAGLPCCTSFACPICAMVCLLSKDECSGET